MVSTKSKKLISSSGVIYSNVSSAVLTTESLNYATFFAVSVMLPAVMKVLLVSKIVGYGFFGFFYYSSIYSLLGTRTLTNPFIMI